MAIPLFSALRIESGSSDAIAHLVFDRPESLNALSRVLLSELAVACRWLDDQSDVKVVVVRGEGRAFSAGFDLGDFARDQERCRRATPPISAGWQPRRSRVFGL